MESLNNILKLEYLELGFTIEAQEDYIELKHFNQIIKRFGLYTPQDTLLLEARKEYDNKINELKALDKL